VTLEILTRAQRGAARRASIVLRGLVPLALAFTGGCERALPESGSAAAKLYQERCGACHRAYAPGALTASMWASQLVAMKPKIAEAGQPALTTAEERTILDYLKRNAGGQ
jgi:hypothetical protein